MHARVVLTALHGLAPGQSFVFDAPAYCVLGRGADCNLSVPNDADHKSVSRHHCLLAVDPPYVWVRDLGSRNGTYVNAVEIGHRAPAPAEALPRPTCELEDGDSILAGNVLLTVHVLQDPDLPERPKASPGRHHCEVGLRVKHPHHPPAKEDSR